MAASKAAQKAIQEALSAFSGTAAEKQGLESFISSLKHSDLPTGWQDNTAIVDAAAKMYQQAGTESPFFKAWGGSPEKMYHQTGSIFDTFDLGKMTHSKEDYLMPSGVFTKSTNADIGLPGKIQMPLFVKFQNPINFLNREEALTYYGEKIPGFSSGATKIEGNDSLYGGIIENIQRNKNGKSSWGKQDKIFSLWDRKNKHIMSELKNKVDEYVKTGNKADSLTMKNDVSGSGTSTDAVVIFDPTNVKSKFNRGTFDPSDPNILKGIGIGAAGLGALTAPNLATAATMQKVNQLGQFDQFAKDMPATSDIPTAMLMAQQYSQRSGIDPDSAYKVLQALGRITPEKGLEEPVWSPIDLAAAPVGAVGVLGKGAAMALDAPVTYAMDAGIEGLMKLLRGKNESSLY